MFVKPEELDRLLEVLTANGVSVDQTRARSEGVREGVFFTWSGNTRIDVFLPSIDLAWEALRTDDERVRTWDDILRRFKAAPT